MQRMLLSDKEQLCRQTACCDLWGAILYPFLLVTFLRTPTAPLENKYRNSVGRLWVSTYWLLDLTGNLHYGHFGDRYFERLPYTNYTLGTLRTLGTPKDQVF